MQYSSNDSIKSLHLLFVSVNIAKFTQDDKIYHQF